MTNPIRVIPGGLLPGLCLYLASFYPRHALQSRISAFFAAASLTGAFSGLLAAAIVKMNGDGGKEGWAWIFILEGLFTVVFGVASFFLLPQSVESVGFLSAEEKAYVKRVLIDDGTQARNEEDDAISVSEIFKTFTQPQVILVTIAGFFNGSTLYGLA